MNILQFLGLAVVTIFIFTIVISLCTYYATKFNDWMLMREERKWDMNLFTIPDRIPELEPYEVTRGIHRTGNTLVFTFKAAGIESMRSYRYKNPKEALKLYKKDFQKDERAFFERSKNDLLEDFSAIKLVERVQAQADRIESDLNQLKQSLGETND